MEDILLKIRTLLFVLFLTLFSTILIALDKHALQPEDLYKIAGVWDPQISPDGQWIAYTVTRHCLDSNSADSDIWLIPLAGGAPKQLTRSSEADHSPQWSPDGSQIAFLSEREGESNIWLIDPKGGEARQLTHSDTALNSLLWSPGGKSLICGSRVLPEGKTDLENPFQDNLPLCNARTINRLLYRQWNHWLGDERNHLFLVSMKDGSLRDITPGDFDTPPVSLAGHHDFDVSPDGNNVCYVKNNPAVNETHGKNVHPAPALSTNHDLFIVSITDNATKQITPNPALDSQPHYSPNGRTIAYTAMQKPEYESDTKRLTIYDLETGKNQIITESLDRSVAEIVWHPDGKRLFFTAVDQGRKSIYSVDLNKKTIQLLTDNGYNSGPAVTPDGHHLVFVRSFCHQPGELFVIPITGGKARQLTFTNKDFLAEIELPRLEEFRFIGAENTEVHGFILKPPFFDEHKKYPIVLTIHGGPQGMWADRFMTAWFTFPLVTSPGYVGIFINPRGSSGYGATFREEVSLDYGGRCYKDLMAGLDYVLDHYPYVDREKLAAIGGSFGGYSVNWIMGNTNRFDCIVSHAGLYNLTSFYGATEELWYPAWDTGSTPWDEPELYAKWSPHHNAARFRTPTLITHGQLDFRVPVTESFQLFTALQVQGIPSRLLYFPDEGHVISTPQNNVRWWKEIHRWLAEYLKE